MREGDMDSLSTGASTGGEIYYTPPSRAGADSRSLVSNPILVNDVESEGGGDDDWREEGETCNCEGKGEYYQNYTNYHQYTTKTKCVDWEVEWGNEDEGWSNENCLHEVKLKREDNRDLWDNQDNWNNEGSNSWNNGYNENY